MASPNTKARKAETDQLKRNAGPQILMHSWSNRTMIRQGRARQKKAIRQAEIEMARVRKNKNGTHD